MKKLSKKSKEIITRYEVHKERCLKILEHFGEKVADQYHEEFKSKPGSKEAEICFNQFMNRLN
jgi:hypothetical protein